MSIDFRLPPPDLVGEFESLEAALKGDASGDKARRLSAYFAAVETEARATQLRSTDFEEKELAGMLAEAFAATGRVVSAAWSKFHGRELAT